MKVLVADDEQPLSRFLERGLSAEGFSCTALNELHDVLPWIRKNTPDIVILDRLFGNEDSLTVLPTIKALPNAPMVLMLTALDDVTERVKGLQDGADDYLCKPFDFDELLARITALGRRGNASVHQPDNTLAAGSLVLYLDERIARLNGVEITLTKIEFELLHYLAENLDKVLSRERILSRVWQTQSDPLTNIIDVYISKLRKKLEPEPGISIQTLRGSGYRMSVA